jgi:hypothetical protein
LDPEAVKSKFATPWVTTCTETRFPGDSIVTVAVSESATPPTDTLEGKTNAGWAQACPERYRKTRQLARRKLLNLESDTVGTRLKRFD